MPTQATDRHRLALVLAAVVSVGLAALSVRTLKAASVSAAKQVPAGDLRSLSAYLAPLPDTTSLGVGSVGSIVGEADPFGAPAPAAHVNGTSVIPSKSVAGVPGQQWVVSSILFENSRRSAIVNDAWVSVGDSLTGGARVAAIERRQVVVTDSRGRRVVVPLQSGRDED